MFLLLHAGLHLVDEGLQEGGERAGEASSGEGCKEVPGEGEEDADVMPVCVPGTSSDCEMSYLSLFTF